MLLRVNRLLTPKGLGLFHDLGIRDDLLGISHDPAHVFFKPDNKEGDLIHQHRKRGIGGIPDKGNLVHSKGDISTAKVRHNPHSKGRR